MAIAQKLDAIRVQNQLMLQAQTPAQQIPITLSLGVINAELTALQLENQTLSNQYLSAVNSRATQLLTDLAAITTTSTWEANLKTVLTLLVQRKMTNTVVWTNVQQNTLESIADQCRHEGGIGVVLARAAINKSDYNDAAMCPGYTQQRSNNCIEMMNTTISPNPASDRCQVRFDKAINGTLTLSSLQGQVLKSIPISNTLSLDFDIGSLPTSLYILQVKANERSIWSGKLAISH